MKMICEDAWNRGEQAYLYPTEGLAIKFPGRKKSGDYLVLAAGNALTHSQMCMVVATYILNGNMTYEYAVNFLEDTYENGLRNREDDPERQYLKMLIFWTTLQEEINYPQSEWNRYHTAMKQGRSRSFNRYAEAIAAVAGRDNIALKAVMERAHDTTISNILLIANPPRYYRR